MRPDFQIQADRDLGDGSPTVCDKPALGAQPPFGGVPGINPTDFDSPSQMITDAFNDLGCRFGNNTTGPCTKNANGIEAFVSAHSTVQFCSESVVDLSYAFPSGDTRLTVRWRDILGQLSPPRSLIIRAP